MRIAVPDVTGLDICQQLRQSATHRHVPVVLMSGCLLEDAQHLALTHGAKDFISKPFVSDDLLGKVFSLLRRAY